jgi:peroxiredoxin Q/BCP
LNDEGDLVTSQDIEGKWTVMFFYPKDESPGCTLQSCSFRDKYNQFVEQGILLYGVSSDSVKSHKRFKQRYKLQYSLLSDVGGLLAKALKLKKDFGFLRARVTFVIDPEGNIAFVHTSQLGVTGHVKKALKVIGSRGVTV